MTVFFLTPQTEAQPVVEDFIVEAIKKARAKEPTANDLIRRMPNGVRMFMVSGRPPAEAPASIIRYMAERDMTKVDGRLGRFGPLVYTTLGKQVITQLQRRMKGRS